MHVNLSANRGLVSAGVVGSVPHLPGRSGLPRREKADRSPSYQAAGPRHINQISSGCNPMLASGVASGERGPYADRSPAGRWR